MTDFMSKEKRSKLMSCIKGKGNKTTELVMMNLFKQYNVTGWRRHIKLTGRPDFTFRKEKVVVFVDGCFWHACPLCQKPIESRNEYWKKKLLNNRRRDRRVTRSLRKDGWAVIRVRECRLARYPEQQIIRVKRKLEF